MKKLILLYALLNSGIVSLQAQICPVFITHMINGNQVSYFGSSPSNPAQWSWFFNGGTPLTSSQQNPVVTYAAPGTYICALSISGGPNSCSASLSATNDTVTITSTGLDETAALDDIKIIRQDGNPVCLISSTKSREAEAELLDLNGRLIAVIYKGRIQEGMNTMHIRAQGLAAGNYILVINLDGQMTSKKFTWNE